MEEKILKCKRCYCENFNERYVGLHDRGTCSLNLKPRKRCERFKTRKGIRYISTMIELKFIRSRWLDRTLFKFMMFYGDAAEYFYKKSERISRIRDEIFYYGY